MRKSCLVLSGLFPPGEWAPWGVGEEGEDSLAWGSWTSYNLFPATSWNAPLYQVHILLEKKENVESSHIPVLFKLMLIGHWNDWMKFNEIWPSCYYFFLLFIADVCLESGMLRHENILFYSECVHWWLFDVPIKQILNVVIDSPNSAIKLFENLLNFKGWKIDGQKNSKILSLKCQTKLRHVHFFHLKENT